MNKEANSTENALIALVAVLEARDGFTKERSVRVSLMASKLARVCKIDQAVQDQIRRAAMLHDIGMISIPDAILLKPGRLSSEERKLINKTPDVAVKILKSITSLKQESDMILHHNEHWDGSGYPGRLKGNQIPIGSRFIAVAKAIDAMTSNRSYRRARPMSYCLEQLEVCSGTQFDPKIAEVASKALSRGLLSNTDAET
ncbi:MAG: HD domain-containing phosphohydrolase [Mariprofundaceae bacterium]